MKDIELIKGLAEGSDLHARYFMKKYKPFIRGVVIKLGYRNDHYIDEIESLSIDAFFGNCKKGLVLSCKISSFLFSIVNNMSKKVYEKEKRYVPILNKEGNFREEVIRKSYVIEETTTPKQDAFKISVNTF